MRENNNPLKPQCYQDIGMLERSFERIIFRITVNHAVSRVQSCLFVNFASGVCLNSVGSTIDFQLPATTHKETDLHRTPERPLSQSVSHHCHVTCMVPLPSVRYASHILKTQPWVAAVVRFLVRDPRCLPLQNQHGDHMIFLCIITPLCLFPPGLWSSVTLPSVSRSWASFHECFFVAASSFGK